VPAGLLVRTLAIVMALRLPEFPAMFDGSQRSAGLAGQRFG